MDNSIYIVLSRQTALFRDLDVTANNIANVNTSGYKSEKILFTDYLTDAGNRQKMAFAQDIATQRNTEDGKMQSTGNPLDFAIAGPGYFSLETPLGTRYTRSGNFQIDTNGNLVSPQGYPVLDEAGQRITFEPEQTDIKVGEAGNITADGEEIATVGISRFENDQSVERLDSTMFKSDATPLPPEGSRIMQGVLESSNVAPITELTRLVELTRNVASTAKFIDTIYDLERRASNTLGRQGGSS